jgi:hypothetical protein
VFDKKKLACQCRLCVNKCPIVGKAGVGVRDGKGPKGRLSSSQGTKEDGDSPPESRDRLSISHPVLPLAVGAVPTTGMTPGPDQCSQQLFKLLGSYCVNTPLIWDPDENRILFYSSPPMDLTNHHSKHTL